MHIAKTGTKLFRGTAFIGILQNMVKVSNVYSS